MTIHYSKPKTRTLPEEMEEFLRSKAEACGETSFFGSLLNSVNAYGRLTEKQFAALQRCYDREKKLEAAPKAKSGTFPVTGTIVGWKVSRGYNTLKVLVESATGNRLFGTVPMAWIRENGTTEKAPTFGGRGYGRIESYLKYPDALKGKKVSFTAEVTAKEDHFSFFKKAKDFRVVGFEPEPVTVSL